MREVDRVRKKEIDQALKVMAGPDETLIVGDRPVVTLKSYRNPPSIDPALEFDLPDIWDAYIRRGTHRRIRICRGWEAA